MPLDLLKRLRVRKEETIVVVSGLPRSGTSMMMRMLAAGGMGILTDHQRVADESNPRGYYELERVKKLKEGDHAWLADARGRAVKIISALLEYLPQDYAYKIIFMQRDMGEILDSQRQMLIRDGKSEGETRDERMAELYRKHLNKVETWLVAQANMQVVYIDYNDTMADPLPTVERVNRFLDRRLDTRAMLSVVDTSLYRERQE